MRGKNIWTVWRRRVGEGGGIAVATFCSQSLGKICHFLDFSILRQLVQHAVAIYWVTISKFVSYFT